MPAYTTDTGETGGRRQTLMAVVFVIVASVALLLPSAQQQLVASGLRASVLRPFIVTQQALSAARLRTVESGQLRSQVDSLVATFATRTHLAEENLRLRGLLGLSQRLGPAFVPAGVVRPGTVGSESMFLLDVGTERGVQISAPVITRHGLL